MPATIQFTSSSPFNLSEDADASVVATLEVFDGAAGEEFLFEVSDKRFTIVFNEEAGLWELRLIGDNLLNFEEAASLNLTITASGSQHTPVTPAEVTINLTDVDESPTDIVVTGGTIAESTAVGSVVASLKAVDPDAADQNATFTYTLVDAPG